MKHIYKLYKASDKKFHVEKYPVIYENSEYIYFKPHDNTHLLKHIKVDYLIDSIEDVDCNFFEENIWWTDSEKYLKHYDKTKDKDILDKRSSHKYIKDIEKSINELNREIEYKSSEMDKLIKRKNELELKKY